MLANYIEQGGPVMYAVLATWIIVLAGMLERAVYGLGRLWRRPAVRIAQLLADDRPEVAKRQIEEERALASRGVERIDAVSKLATSVGLFGTVLGIAQSFFARSSELELAASQVLAKGLSTALFTTIAGLVVFLSGQAFLIVYSEWVAWCERDWNVEEAT